MIDQIRCCFYNTERHIPRVVGEAVLLGLGAYLYLVGVTWSTLERAAIALVILVLIFQRQIVSGLTAGAVKG